MSEKGSPEIKYTFRLTGEHIVSFKIALLLLALLVVLLHAVYSLLNNGSLGVVLEQLLPILISEEPAADTLSVSVYDSFMNPKSIGVEQ